MYAPLEFPIPAPVPHMRLGAVPVSWTDTNPAKPNYPADYIIANPSPLIRMKPPSPTSGVEASFVPVSGGLWLNLNTGEIVDAETMQNIANAAAVNPSILAAPVRSLPSNVASSAVQSQAQSGTLPTAQSTGLTSGETSWWTQSQTIFGIQIPNWGIVAGVGAVGLLMLGGKKGRR